MKASKPLERALKGGSKRLFKRVTIHTYSPENSFKL